MGGEGKDVWTTNGTACGCDRVAGRGEGATTIGRRSGFCYSGGDLMITRKDIETATDHPSCPIDR